MAFFFLATMTPKLSLSRSNKALLSGFHGGGARRIASPACFNFHVNRRRSLSASNGSDLESAQLVMEIIGLLQHIAPDALSMSMMEKGCIMTMADEKTKELLTPSINHLGNENSQERQIRTSWQQGEVKQREGDLGNKNGLNESAIKDFNVEEFVYRNDYLEVLRWWKQLEFSKQPQYFRDQLMKWFMWSISCLPEPHYSKQRVQLSKVLALIFVIDDIFDVLGSYEELVHFTRIIERWDNSEILDSVPSYMKICCNTLYDTTNQIADLIMKEHGLNPIDSLKKSVQFQGNAKNLEDYFIAAN